MRYLVNDLEHVETLRLEMHWIKEDIIKTSVTCSLFLIVCLLGNVKSPICFAFMGFLPFLSVKGNSREVLGGCLGNRPATGRRSTHGKKSRQRETGDVTAF